ncbi:MAG TPA: hypothetical protein VKB90_03790 [Candidatus Acidoferrum sp.]|nr:hypothetical protein [Candidatus Acidoferrum sp.]
MNSSQIDVQTLAVRIERLEAANRRWKSASAIALLFLVSTLLLSTRHAERVAAAARPDRIEQEVLHVRTVEAQDFILKDADGHVHARFGLAPSIDEKLLNGPNGPLRVVPKDGVLPGTATLQFYDDNGHAVWTAPSKPQFMTVR